MTTKEILDMLLELKYSYEYIYLTFMLNKSYEKSFRELLLTDEYSFLEKHITIEMVQKKISIAKKPLKYYKMDNVIDRANKKMYINTRIKKYAEFKGIPVTDVSDFYKENWKLCEKEMYQSFLSETYGTDYKHLKKKRKIFTDPKEDKDPNYNPYIECYAVDCDEKKEYRYNGKKGKVKVYRPRDINDKKYLEGINNILKTKLTAIK